MGLCYKTVYAYNRSSYFKKIYFATDYTKVKHANITTIYRDN